MCSLLAVGICRVAVGIEIVIPEGWDSPTKIAVVPFGGQPVSDGPGPLRPVPVGEVVAFDLLRSGQFDTLSPDNMLSRPVSPEEVYFRDWRILGMDYLVIGRSWRQADGDVALVYHLYDVNTEREIRAARSTVPPAELRDEAHRIADQIYEAVTGVRGAFATKLLYVLVENPGTDNAVYHLKMADSDGERSQTLYRSREPILSPAWSPDLSRVAYVSFETRRSNIVVQDLGTGERTRVAEYPGINSAPAFSPDGRRLAMSLSRDGDPEIYTLDLETRELRRVTRRPDAVDTEPGWSPDGRSLIFTSDRGGRPQIYRKDLDTSLEERLTFKGDYNARARLLPDGRHLVYVHRSNGVYHIAWQDLERDTVRVLTETSLDESPSLAPNGAMLIYATRAEGRGILAVVSVEGRARYVLPSASGDVREPAWSPFASSDGAGAGD